MGAAVASSYGQANAYQQAQEFQNCNSYQQKPIQEAKLQEEEIVSNSNDILPDISLTRVFKWAIVLLVAMALGHKIWNQFGDKITKQMHKALEGSQDKQ